VSNSGHRHCLRAPPAAGTLSFPSRPGSALSAAAQRMLLVVGLLALSSAIVYLGRHGYRDTAHPGRPLSVLGSVYYATVTLSTIGYGDIVPVTTAARLVNTAVITPTRLVVLIILVGTEDSSAQLRVRAALTLALAFAVLADRCGFASILGAFAAGLLVRTIDLTGRAPHPQFQTKLEGIGFGFVIPVFFIATGVQFDARALVRDPAGLVEVPLFLFALLAVRALPALAYARRFGRGRARVAGLMQATSLTFVIVATQIGMASGLITRTVGAALLAAGLLSAALFPAIALKMLQAGPPDALDRDGARARLYLAGPTSSGTGEASGSAEISPRLPRSTGLGQ
jgi:hypothetical protein